MALGVLRWHWWVSRGLWGLWSVKMGTQVAWGVPRWHRGSQGGSGGLKVALGGLRSVHMGTQVALGVSRGLWGS